MPSDNYTVTRIHHVYLAKLKLLMERHNENRQRDLVKSAAKMLEMLIDAEFERTQWPVTKRVVRKKFDPNAPKGLAPPED